VICAAAETSLTHKGGAAKDVAIVGCDPPARRLAKEYHHCYRFHETRHPSAVLELQTGRRTCRESERVGDAFQSLVAAAIPLGIGRVRRRTGRAQKESRSTKASLVHKVNLPSPSRRPNDDPVVDQDLWRQLRASCSASALECTSPPNRPGPEPMLATILVGSRETS
jgi:hypothetical protein